MADDFDKTAERSVDLKKHYQARADKKRVGSLFQVRLDDEMTQQMEHFMLTKGLNRSQALKHILKDFFNRG